MGPHGTAAALHVEIEAMRLAFADARWFVADPVTSPAPLASLLSRKYAESRASAVAPYNAAADVARGSPAVGTDTVSFSVVDADGNAASFINRCAI